MTVTRYLDGFTPRAHVRRALRQVLTGLPGIAVYTVTDSTVVVLRLLHGAQAYPRAGQ